ncbi:MAG: insulinase family protein [Ignavibacteria bacterium]|nr:insulinase family protein [Ignavibacteria bacterium]
MEIINKTILPSGIKVITEKLPHVKSFSLGFWFNVGSVDENEEYNGISHFIEHMLFKGTKKRSAKKIAENIESLGGYLNAFTSKEHTCYYGRGLEGHTKKTFEVLADMILNSVFNENEIRKEAAVIVDELNDIEDSPEELIFDKFEAETYKGNSLAFPIIGTEKNILAFTRDDFIDYLIKHYNFSNLSIVASGAVEHEEIIRLTEKYFNSPKSFPSVQRPLLNFSQWENRFVYKDIQQSHIITGTITSGYKERDRVIVNLLSHILGEGSSSRLFQSVREKNGIAYQINTFLNSYYDCSTFGVYFSTNDKMVNKASGLIKSELEKIKEKKVSEKELNRAKEYLKGSILMGMESTSNRMIRIAQSELYLGRNKTVAESIEEIHSVTADDIHLSANSLFDENKLCRIMIGSKNIFSLPE